jgi:CheY-like chemotaxis protein
VRRSELFNVIADVNAPVLAMPGRPPAVTTSTKRGRVLVVEDNLASQKVARLLLESLGYEADVVDGGAWAIEARSRASYVAVLMDCQMPGIDGYEATAEIRRREGSSRTTPIIAMTASAMRGDREQCLASGMDDYISKPVDPAQLDRVLARWVGSVADGGVQQPPQSADEAINRERVRALREMCASGGGPDRWPQLIGLFLEDAEQRAAKLRLEAAVDAEAVRDLAHGLKGSSANFGATTMRELSGKIESLGRDNSLETVPALVDRLALELERASEALRPGGAGPGPAWRANERWCDRPGRPQGRTAETAATK